MYAAKARGGDGHATYDARASMRRPSLGWSRRPTSRARSSAASSRVAYQPIVDMETGEVTGAEALLRWNHPDRGPIPPADFIPLAEETGSIVELGRWVLETACRQARIWQSRRGAPDLAISVNVSARQLADADSCATSRGPRDDRARPAPASRSRSPRRCSSATTTRRREFRGAQGARRAHRDRRLRHRLLVAELPAPVPDRHPQDRPLVRRPASTRGRIERARPVDPQPQRDAPARQVAEGIETLEQRRALESLGATPDRAICSHGQWSPADMAALTPRRRHLVGHRTNTHVSLPALSTPPPRRHNRGAAAAALISPIPHHEVRLMTSTTDTPARSAPSSRLLVPRPRGRRRHRRRRDRHPPLRPAGPGPELGSIPAPDAQRVGCTGPSSFTDLDGRTLRRHRRRPGDQPGYAGPHPPGGAASNLTPQPKYPLENVKAGKSTTVVPASIDELFAGGLAVNIHKSNDDLKSYTACVDIQ